MRWETIKICIEPLILPITFILFGRYHTQSAGPFVNCCQLHLTDLRDPEAQLERLPQLPQTTCPLSITRAPPPLPLYSHSSPSPPLHPSLHPARDTEGPRLPAPLPPLPSISAPTASPPRRPASLPTRDTPDPTWYGPGDTICEPRGALARDAVTHLWKAPRAFFWYSSCIPRSEAWRHETHTRSETRASINIHTPATYTGAGSEVRSADTAKKHRAPKSSNMFA